MNECRGHLLERVRQGTASTDDRLAFDAHLAKCESCRLSWEIGAAFDRVGVAKDDGATIARLMARTLEQAPSALTNEAAVFQLTDGAAPHAVERPRLVLGRLRRSARRPLLLVALAFSGAAMAGVLAWSRTEQADQPPATRVEPPVVQPAVRPAQPDSADPMREAPEPQSPSPTAETPPLRPPSAVENGRASPSQTALTASSLFRAANDARRAGQRALAVSRYRELDRRFPTSAEASLSRVSLGGLLLEQGQAAAALEQFDLYLRSGSNKPLLAEALYGRGRALGALGQRQREIKNWQQLLSAYPNSPYSGPARRRLDELRAN